MLNARDRKLYERFLEGRDDFSLISTTDPAARRDTKIARYKQENELKLKLEVWPLQTLPKYAGLMHIVVPLQSSDGASRRRRCT